MRDCDRFTPFSPRGFFLKRSMWQDLNLPERVVATILNSSRTPHLAETDLWVNLPSLSGASHAGCGFGGAQGHYYQT